MTAFTRIASFLIGLEIEERAQEETMARRLARLENRQKHELEEIYRALAKIPARAQRPSGGRRRASAHAAGDGMNRQR